MSKSVRFVGRLGGLRALAVLFAVGGLAWVGLSSAARGNASAGAPIAVIDEAVISAAAPVRGKYPVQMVVPGQATFDGSFEEKVVFESADGQHSVRVWESGPGALQTDGYPHDEYCLVLEGTLEITNRSGSSATFGPGDTLVIPKGWQGVWNMKTRFRKQYIVLATSSAAGN